VRKSLNSRTFPDNRKSRADCTLAKSYRPAAKLGIYFATDIEMQESDFREAKNYIAFLQPFFPAKIESLMPNFPKRLDEPTIIDRFFNESEFFGFWRAGDAIVTQCIRRGRHITCQVLTAVCHITCPFECLRIRECRARLL
jgi:choline dehydrogenase-like flavoprotein